MTKNKYMTIEDRKIIEEGLDSKKSFSEISRMLDRSSSTIQREVLRNSSISYWIGAYKHFNNCIYGFHCKHRPKGIQARCRDGVKLFTGNEKVCKYFEEKICPKRFKVPYVCNACKDIRFCVLKKTLYKAEEANKKAKKRISEAREGITLTSEELIELDSILKELVSDKNQSPAVIAINNPDLITVSVRTIYNYIDKNILSTRRIDLPSSVRYRPRKKNITHKVDSHYNEGRRYEDYLNYIKEKPSESIVEIDSVIGIKGGKCLLTIYFNNCGLQLSFLRNHNNSQSVIDIFNSIYEKLGHEDFTKLFQIILTDNGTEFTNPTALENYYTLDKNNKILQTIKRGKVFYCDPASPTQKAHCERNHVFIRKILPKGTTFNNLSQNQVNNFTNHINSYKRKKINNQSPTELFIFIFGIKIADKLGIKIIEPNNINLSSNVLNQ